MRRAGAGVVIAVLWLAGCGGSGDVTLSAGPRESLADAPVRIRATGAGGDAVVRAGVRDARGREWTSRTPLAEVRRDQARPLWMLRHGGEFLFEPPLPEMQVRLEVVEDGRPVARATLRRRFVGEGVRASDVRDGLHGRLFEPAGSDERPAVLVIGGSEGGLATADIAALLASHGSTAMALAYFGAPGLPDELASIPLEYFATALRRLRARPHVDPERVAVLGISRGGEAALLIGATFPRLVHGVVGLVPSNVVYGSLDGTRPAWTLNGRPLPYASLLGDPESSENPSALIRAERITGPVLTVTGGLDGLWPSSAYARALHDRLDARGVRYEHRALEFPDAGHGVGAALPYVPTNAPPELGGSPAADHAAKAKAWPEIVEFMDRLGG